MKLQRLWFKVHSEFTDWETIAIYSWAQNVIRRSTSHTRGEHLQPLNKSVLVFQFFVIPVPSGWRDDLRVSLSMSMRLLTYRGCHGSGHYLDDNVAYRSRIQGWLWVKAHPQDQGIHREILERLEEWTYCQWIKVESREYLHTAVTVLILTWWERETHWLLSECETNERLSFHGHWHLCPARRCRWVALVTTCLVHLQSSQKLWLHYPKQPTLQWVKISIWFLYCNWR